MTEKGDDYHYRNMCHRRKCAQKYDFRNALSDYHPENCNYRFCIESRFQAFKGLIAAPLTMTPAFAKRCGSVGKAVLSIIGDKKGGVSIADATKIVQITGCHFEETRQHKTAVRIVKTEPRFSLKEWEMVPFDHDSYDDWGDDEPTYKFLGWSHYQIQKSPAHGGGFEYAIILDSEKKSVHRPSIFGHRWRSDESMANLIVRYRSDSFKQLREKWGITTMADHDDDMYY
jgi:hypothetical protein